MANKAELVSNIAEKTGLNKKDSSKALEAVLSTVKETLVKGEKVQLVGFGSFEVRKHAQRKGRNPQTGAELTIPETKVPAFKAGKDLKESVKKA